VQTRASFVSAGTERMLVDFAKKNIVGKALQMKWSRYCSQ
jgi:hypothetical protein